MFYPEEAPLTIFPHKGYSIGVHVSRTFAKAIILLLTRTIT